MAETARPQPPQRGKFQPPDSAEEQLFRRIFDRVLDGVRDEVLEAMENRALAYDEVARDELQGSVDRIDEGHVRMGRIVTRMGRLETSLNNAEKVNESRGDKWRIRCDELEKRVDKLSREAKRLREYGKYISYSSFSLHL